MDTRWRREIGRWIALNILFFFSDRFWRRLLSDGFGRVAFVGTSSRKAFVVWRKLASTSLNVVIWRSFYLSISCYRHLKVIVELYLHFLHLLNIEMFQLSIFNLAINWYCGICKASFKVFSFGFLCLFSCSHIYNYCDGVHNRSLSFMWMCKH